MLMFIRFSCDRCAGLLPIIAARHAYRLQDDMAVITDADHARTSCQRERKQDGGDGYNGLLT